MRHLIPWAALLAGSLAGAQGYRTDAPDAPIPYPNRLPDDDDEDERPRGRPRHEADVRTYQGRDEPNVGVSFEGLVGLMMLDSSRGALIETRPAVGARFTWEWGRVIADEFLHEALFADLTWSYAALKDGTEAIFAESNYHYFTLAPAMGLRLGESPFSLYAQLGGGLGYQFASLHVKQGAESQISGLKPVFQYGLGIRGRPALTGDGSVRLSFRLELTRFRRGYMDDTFFGGSVGVTF